jgi:hypothetical protein
VMARRSPLSALPVMSFGSMPNDGGALVLTDMEREQLIASAPDAEAYVKRFLGASEFIAGEDRFALWINDSEAAAACRIGPISERIERVRQNREDSGRAATRQLAATPHRFGEIRYRNTESIMVPSISSGLRKYIPIGYLDPETVISNKGFAIYNTTPWLFALLTSQMHMTWVNAVSGRMRINYQYSNTIVYNNFPVPPLDGARREKLTVAALRVLDVREYHCEKTLAELYDPDLMPDDLRAAHGEVDALVDSIYSKRGYETDEQRLSDLFTMYESMTAEEAANAPARKTKGARE